ncbi:MAG: bifunctional oligoribonuclease/PAP phosphatase NrnA [Bacteroidetes bacterium]|nr:bifunctional oligoribonuclease/PAP phosphatase NrnA [Bacteroidota bacterium]
MKFPQNHIEQLSKLLAEPKNIVIVTHRNPDGDALGSSLGWKFFLEKKGHQITFVTPNPYPATLKWIPGTKYALNYEGEAARKTANDKIKNGDIIFCLDFNAISRLETLGEAISSSTAFKIIIDHHRQPEDFANLTFSDITYCSTSEMIYDIILDFDETDKINREIAECLYTGLVMDNGFFQFSSTTPNALRVGAELVAKGVKPEYISERVNNNFRENRLRYFGYCLHEKLKLVNGSQIAYMMLTQAEIKRFNLQSGESEGLVNYPFKIDGVKVSAYFSEEADRVKISFRSRGQTDVNTFARTYFEGGGHRNAAGGKSLLSLEATEKKFLEALSSLKL